MNVKNGSITSVLTPVSPGRLWIKAIVLAAIFVLTYNGVISLLVRTWWENEEYHHGFLILPFVIYFIWADRDRLKNVPIRPNLLGGIALSFVGGGMLISGTASSVLMAQEISLNVIVTGLVLLLLGTRFLLALSLPLAYLVLMLPLLDNMEQFTESFYWPFQIITATISSKFLEILNISSFRNAQYIELPNIILEVERSCSGIHYLISILAIAIPLAHFTQKGWLRKSALLAFAFTVGVIANSVRVTLIGVWAYYGGKGVHGPMHVLHGFFVAMFGYFFLLLAAWLLSRSQTADIRKGPAGLKSSPVIDEKKFNLAWVFAIVLLLSMEVYLYSYRPAHVQLKKPINTLPLALGDWNGTDIDRFNEPFSVRNPDAEVTRRYTDSSGDTVNFYMGYFEAQAQDKELIYYRTKTLYHAAEEHNIELKPGTAIRVGKKIIDYGGQSYLVLFWYDLNGWTVTNKYKAKISLAFNAITQMRTNGAVFIVFSPVVGAGSQQKALEREADLIKELIPPLNQYLP